MKIKKLKKYHYKFFLRLIAMLPNIIYAINNLGNSWFN